MSLSSTALNIGRLDQVISLQKPTITSGDLGQPSKSYAEVKQVYARVRPLSASERAAAGQEKDLAQVEIVMRDDPGLNITADWRAEWNGAYLDFVGPPLPIAGGSRALRIMARMGETELITRVTAEGNARVTTDDDTRAVV